MPLGRADGMLRRVATGQEQSLEVGREGSTALPKAVWNSLEMGFLPHFTWLRASSPILTEALTHTSPFIVSILSAVRLCSALNHHYSLFLLLRFDFNTKYSYFAKKKYWFSMHPSQNIFLASWHDGKSEL